MPHQLRLHHEQLRIRHVDPPAIVGLLLQLCLHSSSLALEHFVDHLHARKPGEYGCAIAGRIHETLQRCKPLLRPVRRSAKEQSSAIKEQRGVAT